MLILINASELKEITGECEIKSIKLNYFQGGEIIHVLSDLISLNKANYTEFQ